jgi:GWxTD domain-containing protein
LIHGNDAAKLLGQNTFGKEYLTMTMTVTMKTAIPVALMTALLCAAGVALADERLDRLSEDERAWLEEEVVYIIAKEEREVFLDLETFEERQRFIEAFWDRRDPNPATLENEFAKEHYERLEYAVRVLGRDATRPGWKTDRGRYYIMLGPPAEIQRYDGSNEVVTIELWLYNGDTSAGLPARFNLLFFRPNDIGEFELYHPFGDGPEALLHDGFSLRTNQNLAVDLLETVSIDLARASLTVDLSDPTSQMFSARNSRDPQLLRVRPSMGVDRDLAAIEDYPVRKVDTDYLRGYLDYGNRVSADYSFNYIDSRSVFSVLIGPSNTSFVHYSIELEPNDLSLEANEDRSEFYTTLEVTLELRNREGQLLALTQNEPFLRLTATEFEQARAFPFAYRDNFPTLPGLYNVSVILRNRATKEYTVEERDIVVPEISPDESRLGEIVFSSKLDHVLDATESTHKTFQFGSIELDPVPETVFTIDSTAQVLVQVIGPSNGQKVRFSLISEKDSEVKTWHTEDVPVTDLVNGTVTVGVPLLGIDSGEYSLRTELIGEGEAVVSSREDALLVSPRTSIPRAGFVYRHSFNADVPGLLDMTLGEQLMVRGRLEESEERLRRAVEAGNPQLPMARWKLASAVLFRRGADEALELLQPLAEQFPNQVEVVEGLGFAYYIKNDYEKAVGYLEHAQTLRPADTSLLNALGDCYQNVSNIEKAREMFERSLEMNPSQEGVKTRLAELSPAAAR